MLVQNVAKLQIRSMMVEKGKIWQVLQNTIDPDMGKLKMNEEGKQALCPEGRQQ